MPKVSFDLTADEKKVIDKVLGKQTIEDYIKSIISSNEEQALDDEFKSKSKSEKRKLLKK